MSIMKTITGLLNRVTKSHTRLPDEFVSSEFVGPEVRTTGAPGFTDDRIRNPDGIVDYAPRKIIPDLIGGGTEVSDNYPQSAAKVAAPADVEANVPRQTRGRKLDTITETHDARRTFQVAVDVLNGTNTTAQQPENPFNAEYPYNHVRLTESGHLFEADDTPGAERIKESHRTGTYYEIFPDGSKVTKIVRDNFTVVVGNDKVNIQGAATVTVEGDCNMYTKGTLNQQVDGDYNLVVGGDVRVEVGGDIDMLAEGGTITLDTPLVDLTDNLEVASNLEAAGTTTLGTIVTSGGSTIGKTHVHPETGGAGPTGPPQ